MSVTRSSRAAGKGQDVHLHSHDEATPRYSGVRDWQTKVSLSQLLRTSIRLQNAFDLCFNCFGMSAQEAAVLLHCAEEGETSAGKLARAIGRDKARITRLVDSLELGGFLSRKTHPNEHRLSIIKPTSKGRRVAPQLKARFDEVRGQFFEGVANIEIDRLEAVLAQLHANAERLCKPKHR